jgi:hypothetical protein
MEEQNCNDNVCSFQNILMHHTDTKGMNEQAVFDRQISRTKQRINRYISTWVWADSRKEQRQQMNIITLK